MEERAASQPFRELTRSGFGAYTAQGPQERVTRLRSQSPRTDIELEGALVRLDGDRHGLLGHGLLERHLFVWSPVGQSLVGVFLLLCELV